MRKFPDNHFSGIVTDPPYGLSFMGKEWDHGIPDMQYWKEALRICKPGSHLLAFGGTRTFHRLTCVIEDAGWQIRDCIMWLHGNGFPKSHNRFGVPGYGTALKPSWEPIIMAMKPCDGTFAQNAEKWGQGGINIDGCRVETEEKWKCICNPDFRYEGWGMRGISKQGNCGGRWPANLILDEFDEQIIVLKNNIPNDIIQVIQEYFYDYRMPGMSKGICNFSKPINERKREVLQQEMLLPRIVGSDERRESFYVGPEPHSTINSKDEETTQEKRERQSEIQRTLDGQGLPISESRCFESRNESSGSSDDQQARNTRTSNHNGDEVGETLKELGSGASCERNQERQSDRKSGGDGQFDSQKRTQRHFEGIACTAEGERRLKVAACDLPEKWMKYFENSGESVRSPHSSAKMLDEQSGKSISRSGGESYNLHSQHLIGKSPHDRTGHNDSGGASRFFYCAKPSSAERNQGCEGLPTGQTKGGGGLNNTEDDVCGKYGSIKAMKKNIHPTVKPLKLMEYLIKLVAPPKDALILDPFAGSGTTLVAAANLGIKAVGIELSEEYTNIATARLAGTINLFNYQTVTAVGNENPSA